MKTALKLFGSVSLVVLAVALYHGEAQAKPVADDLNPLACGTCTHTTPCNQGCGRAICVFTGSSPVGICKAL